MNDCENIRELLPALVRGELSTREAIIVQTHADSCAECRDQLEVVQILVDSLAPLPDGLETRVIAAVRARPMATSRRWAPARLAIAATIAAAVIGASIFVQMGSGPAAPTASNVDASEVGWAAAEDPVLHGRSILPELTADELEMVLAELDS